MAKAKDVASTQKKEKKTEKSAAKKSAKASTKPKAGLSEELVVDSASEDEAPAAQRSIEPTKKTQEKKSESKVVPPPRPQTSESSEDESDDEDESDEDEEMVDAPALKKPEIIPAKINGVKRKADEVVSSLEDEESSETSDSEDSDQPSSKRAKVVEAAKQSDDSSEQESESGGDDDAAVSKPTQTSSATTGARESIPAKPFVPPRGMSSLSISASLFSESTFSGKQIWHITAPKGVPFQSITEVALDATQSRATVLSHKGTEYILSEQKKRTDGFDRPALPSNQEFVTASNNTIKTLHLQQKINLPNLSKKQADPATGSNAAADIAQPAVSDVRPQPKGLRMRYKPAGFGAGDPGLGSDTEDDTSTAKSKDTKFQFPKTLGAHGSGRPQEADTNAVQKPTKSKHKRKDLDENNVNGGSQLQVSTNVTEELSKEERKKRKAEKKARKEAKAGAT